MKSRKVAVGNRIVGLIDSKGSLVLFNEEEGLQRVILSEKVSSAKFIEDKLFVFTKSSIYKYQLKGLGFESFEQTKYLFEEKKQVKMLDLTTNSKVLAYKLKLTSREKDSVEDGAVQLFKVLKYEGDYQKEEKLDFTKESALYPVNETVSFKRGEELNESSLTSKLNSLVQKRNRLPLNQRKVNRFALRKIKLESVETGGKRSTSVILKGNKPEVKPKHQRNISQTRNIVLEDEKKNNFREFLLENEESPSEEPVSLIKRTSLWVTESENKSILIGKYIETTEGADGKSQDDKKRTVRTLNLDYEREEPNTLRKMKSDQDSPKKEPGMDIKSISSIEGKSVENILQTKNTEERINTIDLQVDDSFENKHEDDSLRREIKERNKIEYDDTFRVKGKAAREERRGSGEEVIEEQDESETVRKNSDVSSASMIYKKPNRQGKGDKNENNRGDKRNSINRGDSPNDQHEDRRINSKERNKEQISKDLKEKHLNEKETNMRGDSKKGEREDEIADEESYREEDLKKERNSNAEREVKKSEGEGKGDKTDDKGVSERRDRSQGNSRIELENKDKEGSKTRNERRDHNKNTEDNFEHENQDKLRKGGNKQKQSNNSSELNSEENNQKQSQEDTYGNTTKSKQKRNKELDQEEPERNESNKGKDYENLKESTKPNNNKGNNKPTEDQNSEDSLETSLVNNGRSERTSDKNSINQGESEIKERKQKNKENEDSIEDSQDGEDKDSRGKQANNESKIDAGKDKYPSNSRKHKENVLSGNNESVGHSDQSDRRKGNKPNIGSISLNTDSAPIDSKKEPSKSRDINNIVLNTVDLDQNDLVSKQKAVVIGPPVKKPDSLTESNEHPNRSNKTSRNATRKDKASKNSSRKSFGKTESVVSNSLEDSVSVTDEDLSSKMKITDSDRNLTTVRIVDKKMTGRGGNSEEGDSYKIEENITPDDLYLGEQSEEEEGTVRARKCKDDSGESESEDRTENNYACDKGGKHKKTAKTKENKKENSKEEDDVLQGRKGKEDEFSNEESKEEKENIKENKKNKGKDAEVKKEREDTPGLEDSKDSESRDEEDQIHKVESSKNREGKNVRENRRGVGSDKVEGESIGKESGSEDAASRNKKTRQPKGNNDEEHFSLEESEEEESEENRKEREQKRNVGKNREDKGSKGFDKGDIERENSLKGIEEQEEGINQRKNIKSRKQANKGGKNEEGKSESEGEISVKDKNNAEILKRNKKNESYESNSKEEDILENKLNKQKQRGNSQNSDLNEENETIRNFNKNKNKGKISKDGKKDNKQGNKDEVSLEDNLEEENSEEGKQVNLKNKRENYVSDSESDDNPGKQGFKKENSKSSSKENINKPENNPNKGESTKQTTDKQLESNEHPPKQSKHSKSKKKDQNNAEQGNKQESKDNSFSSNNQEDESDSSIPNPNIKGITISSNTSEEPNKSTPSNYISKQFNRSEYKREVIPEENNEESYSLKKDSSLKTNQKAPSSPSNGPRTIKHRRRTKGSYIHSPSATPSPSRTSSLDRFDPTNIEDSRSDISQGIRVKHSSRSRDKSEPPTRSNNPQKGGSNPRKFTFNPGEPFDSSEGKEKIPLKEPRLDSNLEDVEEIADSPSGKPILRQMIKRLSEDKTKKSEENREESEERLTPSNKKSFKSFVPDLTLEDVLSSDGSYNSPDVLSARRFHRLRTFTASEGLINPSSDLVLQKIEFPRLQKRKSSFKRKDLDNFTNIDKKVNLNLEDETLGKFGRKDYQRACSPFSEMSDSASPNTTGRKSSLKNISDLRGTKKKVSFSERDLKPASEAVKEQDNAISSSRQPIVPNKRLSNIPSLGCLDENSSGEEIQRKESQFENKLEENKNKVNIDEEPKKAVEDSENSGEDKNSSDPKLSRASGSVRDRKSRNLSQGFDFFKKSSNCSEADKKHTKDEFDFNNLMEEGSDEQVVVESEGEEQEVIVIDANTSKKSRGAEIAGKVNKRLKKAVKEAKEKKLNSSVHSRRNSLLSKASSNKSKDLKKVASQSYMSLDMSLELAKKKKIRKHSDFKDTSAKLPKKGAKKKVKSAKIPSKKTVDKKIKKSKMNKEFSLKDLAVSPAKDSVRQSKDSVSQSKPNRNMETPNFKTINSENKDESPKKSHNKTETPSFNPTDSAKKQSTVSRFSNTPGTKNQKSAKAKINFSFGQAEIAPERSEVNNFEISPSKLVVEVSEHSNQFNFDSNEDSRRNSFVSIVKQEKMSIHSNSLRKRDQKESSLEIESSLEEPNRSRLTKQEELAINQSGISIFSSKKRNSQVQYSMKEYSMEAKKKGKKQNFDFDESDTFLSNPRITEEDTINDVRNSINPLKHKRSKNLIKEDGYESGSAQFSGDKLDIRLSSDSCAGRNKTQKSRAKGKFDHERNPSIAVNDNSFDGQDKANIHDFTDSEANMLDRTLSSGVNVSLDGSERGGMGKRMKSEANVLVSQVGRTNTDFSQYKAKNEPSRNIKGIFKGSSLDKSATKIFKRVLFSQDLADTMKLTVGHSRNNSYVGEEVLLSPPQNKNLFTFKKPEEKTKPSEPAKKPKKKLKTKKFARTGTFKDTYKKIFKTKEDNLDTSTYSENLSLKKKIRAANRKVTAEQKSKKVVKKRLEDIQIKSDEDSNLKEHDSAIPTPTETNVLPELLDSSDRRVYAEEEFKKKILNMKGSTLHALQKNLDTNFNTIRRKARRNSTKELKDLAVRDSVKKIDSEMKILESLRESRTNDEELRKQLIMSIGNFKLKSLKEQIGQLIVEAENEAMKKSAEQELVRDDDQDKCACLSS